MPGQPLPRFLRSLEALAAELVQRKPAAIIVTTISAARAAERATSTIPAVMTGLIDPVGQGLIASLARPAGNTTGLANLAQAVIPKFVAILRGTFPAIHGGRSGRWC